jgi:Phage head-tail joining protein
MPRYRPLVHPAMTEALKRHFFARRVTIQTMDGGAASPSGFVAPIPTSLEGHEDLPAAIQPIDMRGRAEMRGEQLLIAESTHWILLKGAYPAITPQMRVVDDEFGTIFDITRADIDGDRILTRLLCRQVTPVAVEGV